MRPADQIAQFVADALRSGHSRSEIEAALDRAGWSRGEIGRAMAAWAETDFLPPVPRPRPQVTAREAFFYGLMFVALAMSAFHVTTLGFALIDRWLPDVAERYARYDTWTIRWSTATLVVFFPLFLGMNARAERDARGDISKRRSAVRGWFGTITLFLAIIALLTDLIFVIFALLNGDLTARFAARAALVALTAGLIWLYFRGVARDVSDAG